MDLREMFQNPDEGSETAAAAAEIDAMPFAERINHPVYRAAVTSMTAGLALAFGEPGPASVVEKLRAIADEWTSPEVGPDMPPLSPEEHVRVLADAYALAVALLSKLIS